MLKVKIAEKRTVAEDICAFELMDVMGGRLPPFTAGAHVDVHIPGGFIRQYSICNSSRETHRYVLGVLKESASRGGSVAMHRLVESDKLQISEPRNHFPLAEHASHSILISGGIGVTPILSMAEHLLHAGRSFEFHCCVRSRARLAFRDRLESEDMREHVMVHVDEEADTRLDAKSVLARADLETHVYVCGPGGFIEHVLHAAREAGFTEDRLHREHFGGANTSTHEEDQPFEIQIASTGERVFVPAEESAVEALARHGIEVPTSCEQGVCGTCLTKVRGGIPAHRDLFLTDEERRANDRFTPCCSRALSPVLILDL